MAAPQRKTGKMKTGRLILSDKHSELYFMIGTDCSTEKAIALVGKHLRQKRDCAQKSGRVVPIPRELPCIVLFQSCEQPEEVKEDSQIYIQGLILSREKDILVENTTKKISIHRTYQHQNLLSQDPETKTWLYLDTPAEFQHARVSLFEETSRYSP